MRNIIIALWAITLAFAQTAKFPATVVTTQDLGTAKDDSYSTLSTTVNDSILTVDVADGSKFAQYQIIQIGNELMQICSIATNRLTICTATRGFGGTVAAAHNSGATVRGPYVSWHINALGQEVVAIAGHVLPATAGTVAPATCVANKELFINTSAHTVSHCNATGDGWSQIAGSGGGLTIVSSLPVNCDVGSVVSLTGTGAGVYRAESSGPCVWRYLPEQGNPVKDTAIAFTAAGGSRAAWLVAPALDPAASWALSLPPKPTANSVMMLPATTTRSTNDTDVPTATSETSLLGVVTTLGDPGTDSNIPTEKAVRDAIDAIPPGGGGGGTDLNERWNPAAAGRADGNSAYGLWSGSAWAEPWSMDGGYGVVTLQNSGNDWTSYMTVLPTGWTGNFSITFQHMAQVGQTGTYELSYTLACFAFSDYTNVNTSAGISFGLAVLRTTDQSAANIMHSDTLTQADITPGVACAAGKMFQLRVKRTNQGTLAGNGRVLVFGAKASFPYTL